MSIPLAYLFTWRTYGSWLPGNARGTVDPLHNTYGTPLAPPSETRELVSVAAMAHDEFVLTATMRAVVTGTIRDHCRIKRWELHAANVRSNHAHAVVTCGSLDPYTAMEQLKSWATRRLREAAHAGAEQPVWASKGSAQYLWTIDEIRNAVDYVWNQQ